MPSTYTVNLGIEKPATGEQSGTWGDTTNTNFDILDQGINGAVRVTLTSAGSSGSPNALQITNGAVSDGRNKFIEFFSSGDLGGSAYVQLDPNDAEKIVFIRNSLASSRSVLLFQGTYSASRDLEIPAGVDMVVKFDGGGASSATVTDVFTKLRVTELTTPTLTATTADINGGTLDNSVIGGATPAAITGTTIVANTSLNIAGDGATVTGIKDEDNMASNSATKLATQQSIKAYVDSQVGTVDTLAEILANGNTSGSNNLVIDNGQALTSNTINETTAGSGVTIDSVLLKDDVVNATDVETSSISANDGTQVATLANSTGVITIASSVLTTTDINGGSIDNTNIGASTPGTGAFSTLSATGFAVSGSGDVTIDTDTLFVDASEDKVMFGTTYNADGGNVTIRGTYGANNSSDYRGNNALALTGSDPGTTAQGSGINLAFVPVSNRGATAVISGENTGTNKEGGTQLRFSSGAGSFPTAQRDLLLLSYDSGAIFNEGSVAAVDFRVESDSNTHAVFVDAGTNRVGILNNNPAYAFHVDAEIASSGYLRVDSSSTYNGTSLLTLKRNGNTTGDYIQMRDGSNNLFATFDEGGIIFNEIGGDTDFRVESNSNANMLFLDAGNERLHVNGTTGTSTFNVAGSSSFANTATSGALVASGATLSIQGTGSYNSNYFGTDRATVAIRSNEPSNDSWNPTLNIATIRQSLGTNQNATGGIGFTTIDDSNNTGVDDAARIQVINTNGATTTSATGLVFYNNVGGSKTQASQAVFKLASSEAVFNEDSLDIDFRVESNSNTHALFVNAGADGVGMGATSSPVNAAATEGLFYSIGGSLTVASNTETLQINRNGTGGNNRANIGLYNNGTLRGTIGTLGGQDGIYFQSGGNVDNLQMQDGVNVFNESSADIDFRVESDSNTHMLFVDAGNNRVGINVSSPENPLHVNDTSASSQILVQGDSNDASIKFNRSGQTFVVGIDATDNGFKISDDPTLGTTDRLRIASSGAATFTNSLEADSYGFTQNSSATGIQDAIFRSTTGRIEVRAGDVDDMLVIDGTNGVIANDGGVDRDFRVESNNDTHALFVNAENSRIGIRTSNPSYNLDLVSSDTTNPLGIRWYQQLSDVTNSDEQIGVRADHVRNESSGNTMLASGDHTGFSYSLSTGGSGNSTISGDTFGVKVRRAMGSGGNTTGTNYGYHYHSETYGSSDGASYAFYVSNVKPNGGSGARYAFYNNDAAATSVFNGSNVFNESSADADFRVESNNKTNAFMVDAATDQVCIGRGSNSAASADVVTPFGTYGLILESTDGTVADNEFIDITMNTGGGGYQGLMVVANTVKANAGARTQSMLFVAGRGTDGVANVVSTDTGTGAASFTVTFPSNGVARITNTSGSETALTAQFFGGQSF